MRGWRRRFRRPAFRRPGRRTLAVALGVAAVAAIGWFVVIPYPLLLAIRNPGNTALMKQRVREARAAGDTLSIRREWVPLERISRNLQRAVLVAEDDAFYQHGGIDWRALAEEVRWQGGEDFSWTRAEDRAALRAALAYAWEHRSELRGRSTITQQVAKNLYFGTDRSFLRKGMEFVVARRLERHLEKDRILEIYLNIAEWGPGLFGAEAAAQAYFDRSAAELTRSQAAALAATLPHPLTSNPARNPGRMRWRQSLILGRMDAPAGTAPPPIPPPEIEGPAPPGIEVPGGPAAPAAGPGAPPETEPAADSVPAAAPAQGPTPAGQEPIPPPGAPDSVPPAPVPALPPQG